MAEAVTAIFDSRLQDAKPIKLIDPNFRPSKDFSNFEPKSSAYKVNRGRNMALIQSLSNVENIFFPVENDATYRIPHRVIIEVDDPESLKIYLSNNRQRIIKDSNCIFLGKFMLFC